MSVLRPRDDRLRRPIASKPSTSSRETTTANNNNKNYVNNNDSALSRSHL